MPMSYRENWNLDAQVFHYYSPTRICFGAGCVGERGALFSLCGGRALVVAGAGSARKNAALNDVLAALERAGIGHALFEGVEPNPALGTAERCAAAGRAAGADFVIGVGGGSTLDAAKAAAVLMANPGWTGQDLYRIQPETPALPLAAVPTTSGSGSEVTPYTVLTDAAQESKRAFQSLHTFPRLALLDPKYTATLSADVTVHTAVDALSHLVEGYISKKSNALTDALAEKGMRLFREVMPGLISRHLGPDEREKMLLVSLLGGLVIASAGTATVHPLGYPLTYHRNIPHGRANGYLMASQLKRCESLSDKIWTILETLDLGTLDEFDQMLETLLGKREAFTEDELRRYAAQAIQSKNHLHNPYPVSEDVLLSMLKESLIER